MTSVRSRLLASALIPTGILLSTLAVGSTTRANPTGGQIVVGSATIHQPTPALTVVDQASLKAVIDWRAFSIGPGERTRFDQPGASAIVLNRVTGGDPSAILGDLTANGQVWLINPNGIVFGKSARVDVAGLLATTLDITNSDFMAGRYRFAGSSSAGAIVNAGRITVADAGLAALVAPGIQNSGVIEARYGRIELLGARGFTLDFYGDGAVTFLARGAMHETLSSKSAPSGHVAMTADAVKAVVDEAVNMAGYAQASTGHKADGVITLIGPATGTVVVSGQLDTSGGAGQAGGLIEVTGADVHLASTARLNASGGLSGGTVLVGGDLHGQGALANATTTEVEQGALIRVDAVARGDGGKAVIWSDDRTTFSGTILAVGGSAQGDGGSVEVSGKRRLAFDGSVDLRAAHGALGSLLLDPEDVTIAATGDTPTLPASGDTNFVPNADSSVLSTTSLQNALALGNVTVSTGSSGTQPGDITVAGSIAWSSGSNLTLSAFRSVTVNDGVVITNTGAGRLNLRADATGTGTGAVNFVGSGKVDYSRSTGLVSIYYNPVGNPAGSAVNTTSYTAPANYASSVMTNSTIAGQLSAYMLVNTVFDLQNIQNNLAANYALGRDIDASSAAAWTSPIGLGFIPIGRGSNFAPAFSGTFEGLGHTIDRLTINSTATNNSAAWFVGLFGGTSGTAVVRDVGLTNISYTRTPTAADISGNYVGGLVGQNHGMILNSYVTGTITTNGSAYLSPGAPPNVSVLAGGIAGANGGTISGSYANVAINAGTDNAIELLGGLAGSVGSGSTIINSYAIGSIGATYGNTQYIGGLVGQVFGGSIANSYASERLTAVGTAQPRTVSIGTLVGYTELGKLNIANTYWNTDVEGAGSNSVGGTGLTAAQLKAGLPSGFDPGVWAIDSAVNNGYPYLKWQMASTSSAPPAATVTFGVPAPPPPPPVTSPPVTPPPPVGPLPTSPPIVPPNNSSLYLGISKDMELAQTIRSELDMPPKVGSPQASTTSLPPGYGIDLWRYNPSLPEVAGAALQYAYLADAAYAPLDPIYTENGQWDFVENWEVLLRSGLRRWNSAQVDLFINEIRATGFSASVYKKCDKVYKKCDKYVLTFRGTESLTNREDWKSNFEQGARGEVAKNQYEYAVIIARQALASYGPNVILTGHSLGGGLAQYAAANIGQNVRAVTFNAAGINDKLAGNRRFRNIVNIRVDGDPVSEIGAQIGANQYTIPNIEGPLVLANQIDLVGVGMYLYDAHTGGGGAKVVIKSLKHKWLEGHLKQRKNEAGKYYE